MATLTDDPDDYRLAAEDYTQKPQRHAITEPAESSATKSYPPGDGLSIPRAQSSEPLESIKEDTVHVPRLSKPGKPDETSGYLDIESTLGEKEPSRHNPLLRVPGISYVASRLFSSVGVISSGGMLSPATLAGVFSSAGTPDNQGATSSARVLQTAEHIFKNRAKPHAILSELTFEQVPGTVLVNGVKVSPEDSSEHAISLVKDAINIDIETIKVSLPKILIH